MDGNNKSVIVNNKKQKIMKKYIWYIAKQNLPGGVIKGDRIYFDGQSYKFEKGTFCAYNCANEPSFFEREEEKLFEINERIIYNNIKGHIFRDLKNGQLVELISYVNFDIKQKSWIIRILDLQGRQFEIPEKYFSKSISYFFINSEGDIHETFEGNNKKRDYWTKISCNRFTTRSEAEKCKQNIIN